MKVETLWKIAYGDKPMSVSMAKKIQKFRKDNSWRRVAYYMTNGENDNQLLGMNLCIIARRIVGGNDW